MAAKYKYHYWDCYGRGEANRMIFAVAGEKFEDVRWAEEKFAEKKEETPTRALPYMEIEGVGRLAQSGSIAMYLGTEFGMAGKNNFENAQISMFLACLYDIGTAHYDTLFEKDAARKAEAETKVKNESFPNMLRKLNEMCEGKYLFGDKLSVADISLFAFFDQMTVPIGDKDQYPRLKAVVDEVGRIPNMQQYLKDRPKHDV